MYFVSWQGLFAICTLLAVICRLVHYHHHTWFLHDLNLFGITSWLVLAWVHLLFPLFCYIEDNVEIKCGGGDYFWLLLELVSSSFGWLHLDYVFGVKDEKSLKNFEFLLHFYTCYPWIWPFFKKKNCLNVHLVGYWCWN